MIQKVSNSLSGQRILPRVARHCVLEHARNVASSDVPWQSRLLLQFYIDEGCATDERKQMQRRAALLIEASYFELL